MAPPVHVIGGVQLTILANRLRVAGAKDLRRELVKGLNRSTKPLRKAAKDSAKARLPRAGGLGRRVARTRMTTRTRLKPTSVSVDIQAKPGAVADPLRVDRGRIRHPVWGRGPWVLQDVPKGWFTKPMEEGEPVVQLELSGVMGEVSARLTRGL
jgi:hypothetical protein